MNTDELIAALAADTTPRPAPAARLLPALLPGLALSALAVLLVWRVRPDLTDALTAFPLVKTLAPLALAAIALPLARHLTRPEAHPRALWAVIGAMALTAVVALGWGLSQQGLAGLWSALDTPNALTCFVSVPVLSALPFAGAMAAMRGGAPASPLQAGAAAGLVSGAAATALYSLHCPEDSSLFFLPAYGLSILGMTGLGALIGRRLLRW